MTRSNFLSGVGGNNTPLFRAGGPASNQSIPNSTYTKVTFSNEIYDPSGVYDASSNYRFTPTIPGYYQFQMNQSISHGSIQASYIAISH